MSDSPILPRTMFIEEFLPLKGRTFLADCDPRAVELELFDVIGGKTAPTLERLNFILLFRSEPDALLVAGIYKLKCGSFGPEVIYLESTTPPADGPPGYYYQAVFN